MKWTKQIVAVLRMGGELRPTPALASHPFAIHRAPAVPWGYNLTHIPTGLAINERPISTQREAKALAEKLALLEAPWESTNREELRRPDVAQVVKDSRHSRRT